MPPRPTLPRPIRPQALAMLIVDRALALGVTHPVRLAVDAPPWAGLPLAQLVVAALTERAVPVLPVGTRDFLRAASLRLERGRDDPDAFYTDWVDFEALRRVALDPAGPEGSRRQLPSLWDADRARDTRADYHTVTDDPVVVVDGAFVLG